LIPRRFIGENIIHLPTVKTHVFTTTTGAMKNAFGGLLNERRHWTHPVIHETLGTLAAERVRINRELNEHVINSIKLREIERQLGKCYDQLAEMLIPPGDRPAEDVT